MSDLSELESFALALLDRDEPIPADDVCEFISRLDDAERRIRVTKKLLFREFLPIYLPTVGGELVVGEVRYYLGYETDTLNNDTSATLNELFTATGGDMDAVAGCLCSQPFKHGTCKKVLPPEVYAKLFTVVEKRKAKAEKPEKKVLAINPKFINAG